MPIHRTTLTIACSSFLADRRPANEVFGLSRAALKGEKIKICCEADIINLLQSTSTVIGASVMDETGVLMTRRGSGGVMATSMTGARSEHGNTRLLQVQAGVA